MKETLKKSSKKALHQISKLRQKILGPIEKGFSSARLQVPTKESYQGLQLSALPQYISYKSALIKEKTTLQSLVLIVSVILLGFLAISRAEISSLYGKLRQKEYILAPGVLDFTTASPQSIPDNYIQDAVTDFLSSLGNVNPRNIDEQYHSLKRFMSDRLKIQFERETKEWVSQVKNEDISQILSVRQKEITTNEDGDYRVVAFGRAEFYADQQYLGYEDQVIEMKLRLVPPDRGKRWYLEMNSLSWSKADTFKRKQKLEN